MPLSLMPRGTRPRPRAPGGNTARSIITDFLMEKSRLTASTALARFKHSPNAGSGGRSCYKVERGVNGRAKLDPSTESSETPEGIQLRLQPLVAQPSEQRGHVRRFEGTEIRYLPETRRDDSPDRGSTGGLQ